MGRIINVKSETEGTIKWRSWSNENVEKKTATKKTNKQKHRNLESSISECGEAHIIRAQSNCTAYNGTWYNMTCWFQEQTDPDVYENVYHLANFSGKVDIKSPSDEYFQ